MKFATTIFAAAALIAGSASLAGASTNDDATELFNGTGSTSIERAELGGRTSQDSFKVAHRDGDNDDYGRDDDSYENDRDDDHNGHDRRHKRDHDDRDHSRGHDSDDR